MIQSLKQLRMWHWRMAMTSREQNRKALTRAQNTQDKLYSGRMLNLANLKEQEVGFHIRACQLLNDVLPGTAERDCDIDDAKIANETVEVEGIKWLIVEASDKEIAMDAINFARVRGSTGTTYKETTGDEVTKYAEVTRNGVAQ